MISTKTLHYKIKFAADIISIIISFFSSYYLLYGSQTANLNKELWVLFLSFIVWYYIAQNIKLYNETRARTLIYEIILTLRGVLYLSIFTIVLSFIFSTMTLNRLFIIYFGIASSAVLLLQKLIVRHFLTVVRSRGRNIKNLLIVGAGPVGDDFFNLIKRNPQYGYRLLGFLDDDKKDYYNGQYLGSVQQLEELLNSRQVDDVVVALPNYASEKIEQVIKICQNFTTRVRIIPDVFRFSNGRFYMELFDKFPIVTLQNEKINEFQWRVLKRLFDIIFSLGVILLLFSWLFPVIALLIKLDSKGPVFFHQDRWGRNNRRFKALKFRSMIQTSSDTDEAGKYQQATKNDSRVTKVGAFLRKTNLDELPQFINVLLGDMTVVGPRPHPVPLNEESKKTVPRYMQRTLVKPGITGWAQVNGFRGETRNSDLMHKRIEHDLWYMENWSFYLDFEIILLTVWQMVKGDPNAF